MKLFKIISLVIIFVFAVLILLMNFTSGHFQPKSCTCGSIGYLTDIENDLLTAKCNKNGILSCYISPFGKITYSLLLNLARIDFYK